MRKVEWTDPNRLLQCKYVKTAVDVDAGGRQLGLPGKQVLQPGARDLFQAIPLDQGLQRNEPSLDKGMYTMPSTLVSAWQRLAEMTAAYHRNVLEPWYIAIPSSVWSVQSVPWELQAAHQVYSILGTETDGAAAKAGRAEHLVS
ncbi:hypothetical protein EK904_011872 [Melospiza melodia maxima]|nr:hypothetical protein EK904_011872 [Melospiza melodia maxima]